MSNATFRGGVHPYEGKELSSDLPIKNVMPKGDMVFPMAQHIGAPAKPIVAKGDRVLVGQKIGEASGFISANICQNFMSLKWSARDAKMKTNQKVLTLLSKSLVGKNSYIINFKTMKKYVCALKKIKVFLLPK